MMGVIDLNPKEILVDGICRELRNKLAEMLHKEFVFLTPENKKGQPLEKKFYNQDEVNAKGDKVQDGMGAFGDFGEKFARLKDNFVGLKRAIEYIEDFLNVQGEKIWREELTRIVHSAVDKEAMRLVNKRISANIDSNDKDLVPEFEPLDEHDATFMGRLLRQIITSMNKGFYIDSMSTWYDHQGNQTFGLRFIHFL
jgi:WASH complex subunit strumpellin